MAVTEEANTVTSYAIYVLGALLTLPFFLAINFAVHRNRDASGASHADSVEFHGQREAESKTFRDALVIMALSMIGLSLWPSAVPAVWMGAALALVAADFWVRYYLQMRAVRG